MLRQIKLLIQKQLKISQSWSD